MKRSIVVLFTFLLIITIQSCKSHSTKNDLEKMNLKGSVIGVKLKGSVVGVKYEDDDFYFFNKDGFIEKIIHYKDKNSKVIYSIEEFIYTDNLLNKIIKKNNIYPNEADEIVKVDGLNENVITNYIYNKEKQLIKTIENFSIDENIIKYFFYNNDGKLIKDSSFTEYLTKPEFKHLITSEVNKYTYLNDEVTHDEIFYDEKFIQKIAKFKDEFGEFYISEKKIEFEFSKDNIGNWVQKKWNINGEPKIASRILFYKGEDISSYIDDYNNFKSSKGESNNKIIQEIEKKWINCRYCHGTGMVDCDYCKGSGMSINGTNCFICEGKRSLNCENCYGRGQVQE